jgi:hypothetical protein
VQEKQWILEIVKNFHAQIIHQIVYQDFGEHGVRGHLVQQAVDLECKHDKDFVLGNHVMVLECKEWHVIFENVLNHNGVNGVDGQCVQEHVEKD